LRHETNPKKITAMNTHNNGKSKRINESETETSREDQAKQKDTDDTTQK
jgi:hypothetical protein